MSGPATAPSELHVVGGAPLRGRLRLPGCKGISHRALIFAAIADGRSTVRGLADGADVASTMTVLDGLGVKLRPDGDAVSVRGLGFDGLREPTSVLDCGNSGTTMRMLAGLLAGRDFFAVLVGDESLSARPMRRVLDPIAAMGARVDGRDGGARAPITVRGGSLRGVRHQLATASGQVKTALILAGLQAEGTTEIVEPAPSRDHTERMLAALGVEIDRPSPETVSVARGEPMPFELTVPGDPSSAAFFVVGACITPGSDLVLEAVSLNPARIGYVDVLRRMGAEIDVVVTGEQVGEPVGDISVRAAELHGTDIAGDESIIDELPVLAVAAAFAEGTTTIHSAAELAVKESNRIGTMEQELTQLGIGVETRPDGLVIRGGAPRGASLKSHGDHRIAMAGAIAGLAAEGETTVRGFAATAISYPGFARDLASVLAQ
ncbi:MAG: 3-phosphoshikimate 1-carboxyvinyltransferase [Acidimicrobiia bacterium]|nr:3-phosphoshikimate 1-carboxyvinyltransferase [Acidimicrobiia bacterium]